MWTRTRIAPLIALLLCLCSSWTWPAAASLAGPLPSPAPPPPAIAPIVPAFRFDVPIDQQSSLRILTELTSRYELDASRIAALRELLRTRSAAIADHEARVGAEAAGMQQEGAALALRMLEGEPPEGADEAVREAWRTEVAALREEVDAIALAIRTLHARRQAEGDALRSELCADVAQLLEVDGDDLCWRIELAVLRTRLVPPEQAMFEDFRRFMDVRTWLPGTAAWYPPLACLVATAPDDDPEWMDDQRERIAAARAAIAALLDEYDRSAHAFLIDWVRGNRQVRPPGDRSTGPTTFHRRYWAMTQPYLDGIGEQCRLGLGDAAATEFHRATFRSSAPGLTGPWRADVASRMIEAQEPAISAISAEFWEAVASSIDAYRARREELIAAAVPMGRQAMTQFGTLDGDEAAKVAYRAARDRVRALSVQQLETFTTLFGNDPKSAALWKQIRDECERFSEPIHDPSLAGWNSTRW